MSFAPPHCHGLVPPTARQAETLRVIAEFRAATGEFPSQRYLARRLNVALSVIQARLVALWQRGWLATPTPAGLRCTHL